MNDIVIRHAEPKDYDAIRHIHAQPEVYHNTLQVPYPSGHMWQERLAERPGGRALSSWSPALIIASLATLALTLFSDHAAATLPILGYALMRNGKIVASPARCSAP